MRHRRALAITPPVLFLLVTLLHPRPAWAHIVGTGLLVRRVMLLDGAERETAARLAQWFWDARLDPRWPVMWVIGVGTLSWLIAMIATALALRRAGARRRIAVLLILSGIALAIDHPFPTGTIAMLCLMIAVSLRERTRFVVS